ncbi:related to Protein PUN1 [Saccharomycodes ludwigii]|uniref:Related to Protein PUN1 n=1 Tax=Saccharomycodes ludwigii TaxID=36035 RepID=A0A376B6V2_9ASCO|nr:hypothetical protein SCDLUD_004292 [Saccharomycodes ludwigii]KAH3899976.1 hypothetical protein SCDLUD_004292 [Saccharomycodes ludwigii]SSD60413.1 related to Protein PUN1 [Saccharomycodes ludwigii]
MVNCCSLIITGFVTFATFILAIVACAGSTKNYIPLNKIYAAQINLVNLNESSVFASSTITSETDLDLPSYINVGLWSYCIAGSNGTVESCTSPSGIQEFNLQKMLYDNIDNNEALSLIDSIADIVLPSKITKNIKYYNNLCKCMFITIIIGIVLLFIGFVLNIIRLILHFSFLIWCCRFLTIISFISLLIGAGTSTATYMYLKSALKKEYTDYGISLSLGTNYYALLWASVGGCFLNLFLWFGMVRQNKPYKAAIVQPVAMEERQIL